MLPGPSRITPGLAKRALKFPHLQGPRKSKTENGEFRG